MPRTRHITARLRPVIAWTRRTNAAFFDLVARGVENLHLHRLLAEGPLRSRIRCCAARSSLAGTTSPFAVTADPTPAVDQMLPSPHDRLVDPQFSTQFGEGDFIAEHRTDLITLAFRRE